MAAQEISQDPARSRLSDLDGVRGWASLSVLFFHVFWETFGNVEAVFRNAATASLFNGAMAVSIFFVLSGEALSIGYWRTGSRYLLMQLCVKRYPRLTIPIFFSCLAVYLLMKMGLVFSAEAAVVVDSPNWLGAFLHLEPDLGTLLRYSLFDVYVHHTDGHSFNPFLWTMRSEILGSLVVFVFLGIERYLKLKILVLIALVVVFFQLKSYIACFLVGVIFAKMRTEGQFLRLQEIRWVQPLSWGVLGIVLLFIAHKQIVGHSGVRPYVVASTLLLFVVHCNKTITEFMRNGISAWLGKISFPLYLVHFPVIASFTSASIVVANNHGGLTIPMIILIALASVVLSLASAWAFAPVEALTRKICALAGCLVPQGKKNLARA